MARKQWWTAFCRTKLNPHQSLIYIYSDNPIISTLHPYTQPTEKTHVWMSGVENTGKGSTWCCLGERELFKRVVAIHHVTRRPSEQFTPKIGVRVTLTKHKALCTEPWCLVALFKCQCFNQKRVGELSKKLFLNSPGVYTVLSQEVIEGFTRECYPYCYIFLC